MQKVLCCISGGEEFTRSWLYKANPLGNHRKFLIRLSLWSWLGQEKFSGSST